MPCGHSSFCLTCSYKLLGGAHVEETQEPRCPICRREISEVLPVQDTPPSGSQEHGSLWLVLQDVASPIFSAYHSLTHRINGQ